MNNKSFSKIKFYLTLHRDKIKAVAEIVRSIAEFAITNSKFSLISGGVAGVEKLFSLGVNDPRVLFSPTNNWIPITSYEPIHNLFFSTINRLEGKRLPFEYYDAKMFTTPHGDIVAIYDRYDNGNVLILAEKDKHKGILKFLGDKKIEELNSQYLSLDEINTDKNLSQLILAPFSLKSIPSQRSQEFISEIERSLEKGIHRSFMFYGLPGTGKTTLSQTIIDHFKFRTLKIRPKDSLKLPYFVEILDLLKIEAVILDDFDQIEMTDDLLEFLEIVNNKLKLTIGIANILEGFDPAVLRPGRFDEVVKVEELEETTIKELLGELTESCFDRVRHWPIAYIKELVKQYQLNPQKLEEKFADLQTRIENLKNSYIEKKEKEDEKENDDG
jgi:adenylate kinase family enzyme